VAGPILDIDFLRKFRITVAPETSQVLFACTATAPAAAKLFMINVLQIAEPSFSVPAATELSAMQTIPDSVPEDVKRWLQKFLSILRTGDVMLTPAHGVEHHIHMGSHPPVFAKTHHQDPEKLEMQKKNLNVWKLPVLFAVQNHYGPPLCTWCLMKKDPGDLVAIIAVSI
jgi:hypothetical protein